MFLHICWYMQLLKHYVADKQAWKYAVFYVSIKSFGLNGIHPTQQNGHRNKLLKWSHYTILILRIPNISSKRVYSFGQFSLYFVRKESRIHGQNYVDRNFTSYCYFSREVGGKSIKYPSKWRDQV